MGDVAQAARKSASVVSDYRAGIAGAARQRAPRGSPRVGRFETETRACCWFESCPKRRRRRDSPRLQRRTRRGWRGACVQHRERPRCCGMLWLRTAFFAAMRLCFLAYFLVLPGCGLYDDHSPVDGAFAGAGSGGANSAPAPSVACAPMPLGSESGVLVPPSPLVSRGVDADGCDPSFPGDAQYSWTAPAAGCYTISTLGPFDRPAKSKLKVTRDTCDGSPVLCSSDNYGYVGPIGPLAQGDRLVIALTKIEAGNAAVNYSLAVAGPYIAGHTSDGLAHCSPWD